MASLVLGAFQMLASDGSARVMAEGTSWGSPVPIEVAINSFLQDGAIVVTQGHDNREVDVKVRFYGDNLTALNAKEALLFAELEKPNTLTWTPDNGPATVFVVVTSSLVQNDESFVGEVQGDPWRTYNVRLLCEAFPRSATETVATALAANGTTTTLVNDGSATTNWTGSVSSGVLTGPTVVSGAVKVGTTAALYGAVTATATLTTSITTSSTKYLVVDWKPESNAGFPTLRAYGDGTELDKAGETVSPTSGFTRTWFGPVAASSIAALRLDSLSTITGLPDSSAIRSLYIDNINHTDIKPSLGTAHQLLRSIPISGSARTAASLAVEHASAALGDVMVYVFPDSVVGYSPPLRQYRVSGGATTGDATMVSGSTENIQGATVTFDIPASKLVSGGHLLSVKLATSATSVLTWTASTRVNGTQIGSATTGTYALTNTGSAQTIFAVTRVILPTVNVRSDLSTNVVRISLNASGASAVTLDEAWLFNYDIGSLIGPVACGPSFPASGGVANRLFIEPPTVSTPRPTILIGFAADRSDAFFPAGALSGWQFPQFKPPRVNVFTVTTGTTALDASVTLRYFARFHTNAAS